MADPIAQRLTAAKARPIDVYGDVLNNPRERLKQEFGIEALVGDHESNKKGAEPINKSKSDSTKGEGTKKSKKTHASSHISHMEKMRAKAQKRPAHKGDYETEYARRMSGKPTRFTK